MKNIFGGGAKTNENGLKFEQETKLDDVLLSNGLEVKNFTVYKDGEVIGYSVPKHALYSVVLEPNKIDWQKIISKKLLPDEAF